ncbi:MAG: hypothetical protein KDK91_32165, partial [Gammaproteobacteria bacterium]|nr:hypothetical protein [Gammaproteobacteria bacterium]
MPIERLQQVSGRSVRYVSWLGLFLLAIALGFADRVRAQAIAPVPDITSGDATLLPLPARGDWRVQVQLVWNAAKGRLERRRYEIFDPLAEAGLDIFWEARDLSADRPGRIQGEGVLTWRTPGALRHGHESIVAQYRGRFVDGRFAGHGTFVERSGLRYVGEWVAGLMHGLGHLRLASGDDYQGEFKAGRIHGLGVYVDATGRIYDGGFLAGLRHGPARVLQPNGHRYASVWTHGTEDLTRRGPGPPGWSQRYAIKVAADDDPALAITIGVGDGSGFCCHTGPPSLGYAATPFADRIEIYPDAPVLMDIWRGRANIVVAYSLTSDWTREGVEEYSFQSYSQSQLKPLALRFGLENRSTRPVNVIGAYLEVERSRVDTQPALQASALTPISGQSIEFSIENYGWSPALDARLDFRFQNPGEGRQSEPLQVPIGEIDGIDQFSFAPALAELGVDVDRLRNLDHACLKEWPESAQMAQQCLNEVIGTGVFGRLSPLVFIDPDQFHTRFGVRAIGRVEYDWRDSDGQLQHTAAPFEAFVPLLSMRSPAECEGGDFQIIAGGKPF